MSRLIIDVSGEQHQQIKAMAALQGKTIKDYVLEKIFPQKSDEDVAWQELTDLLESRIKEAEAQDLPTQSFEDITTEILQAQK
jgi:predicted lipoprotein